MTKFSSTQLTQFSPFNGKLLNFYLDLLDSVNSNHFWREKSLQKNYIWFSLNNKLIQKASRNSPPIYHTSHHPSLLKPNFLTVFWLKLLTCERHNKSYSPVTRARRWGYYHGLVGWEFYNLVSFRKGDNIKPRQTPSSKTHSNKIRNSLFATRSIF